MPFFFQIISELPPHAPFQLFIYIFADIEDNNTDKFQLRILTQNVWGVYVMPFLEERIEAMAAVIRRYDIISLQEVSVV